jgi:colanic acid/amylovoran biosynthesis glycosyltransferase
MIFFPPTWNFRDGLGAMVGLRLAYMTGEYPRVTDTFIQREVLALRALGHYVKTFSVRHPPDNESAGEDAAESRRTTIYLLPPRNLVGAHVAQFFRSPRDYFSAFKLAWKNCPPGIKAITRQAAYFAEAGILAQGMAKHSLSHLHNHFADSSCSVASIAAEMGGFTFSFTIHGPAEFFETRLWWINEKIKRALFVNCISYYCRSQAMSLTPSDCWEKLRVVHCGVDPRTIEVKKHEGLGRRLLFVGRLAVAKGLPFLLDAVAKVEGAILDVAGDGPERGHLEMKTTRLGIAGRVRFLGYQSQSDVRKLMQQADLFVMTSLSEGLPVVLMEAMAAGVPVVTTRIAGVPELVDDGDDGLLVLPGDADATAAAVRRLLADPELRNRFAIAGRAKVEREFNLQSEVSWLVRIMTSALSGGSERVRP